MTWASMQAAAAAGGEVRRVAIVDLGSNSWRLVVFAYGPGPWWRRTDELYETVRIGAGLAASGRLSPAAMRRGMETLDVFARFCRAARIAAPDIHVVATSAIRDADNGPTYLREVRERTGLEVEVLGPGQEAFFGDVAAVNSTTLTEGVVLDIGGGSLQLSRIRERRARERASFPLGAVRITEAMLAGAGARPAKRKELARVRAHVRELIGAGAPWVAARRGEPPRRLVGLGGATRNLAAAAAGAAGAVDLGVQGFRLTAPRLEALVGELAALGAEGRGAVPGIKPGRGDIILAAAVVLAEVLALGDFPAIEVTEAGLREGVFLARTLLDPADPLIQDVRAAAVENLALQYESDLPHVRHVAHLCLGLWDSLHDADGFTPAPAERELLWAAAMLHDVGMAISYDDHHKHSRYLVEAAELWGFDPRERALIGQICRYHRKGTPRLGAIGPLAARGDEAMLARCATLLRLAEHLERGRDQSVSEARLSTDGDGLGLHLRADGDLTLPRWSVERYGDGEAFARVFGRELVIG